MSSLSHLVAGAMALWLFAACGQENKPSAVRENVPDAATNSPRADARANTPPDGAATTSDASTMADTSAGQDAAAPRFGLTSRPANTTCRAPEAVDRPAARLSLTGCVDPADPRRPAAGLIPYDINSPLWSDGAEKQRWMALPEGTRLHVKDCQREPATCGPRAGGGTFGDEGHIGVPEGTVLVKSFSLAGKRIETRLLVYFGSDTWVGYSYRWRADESDADLLADNTNGYSHMVSNGAGMQSWHFPSRTQCLKCHIDAAGVSLGLELAQLDRDVTYPSGVTSSQLATLENIGLFDAPVRRPVRPLPVPSRESDGNVEQRARSYLHTNCGVCHRPGSNFPAFDLRFGTSFADSKVCNGPLEKGDLGTTGGKLLVPGKPEQSLVHVRMMRTTDGRMPQLGTSVVDTQGAALVAAWIRSIARCP